MRPTGARDVLALQASLLRTLASPRRLQILQRLGRGPAGVHELADALGASQPSTSADLASLRGVGLVEAVRDGRAVRYQLTDPEIVRACGLVREVLARRLSRLGAMATAARRVARATDPNGPSTSVGKALPPFQP